MTPQTVWQIGKWERIASTNYETNLWRLRSVGIKFIIYPFFYWFLEMEGIFQTCQKGIREYYKKYGGILFNLHKKMAQVQTVLKTS